MPSDVNETKPAPAPSLSSTVNRLARALGRELSPGDVASLRRMAPDDVATPAFWKLTGGVLDDELRGEGPAIDTRERLWAVVVNALALTSGLHAPGRSFGGALAEAGLSELRLARLLRAHGDALPAEVRSVAAYLASKAIAFDATDLARLVLSDGGASEEPVRRGIAKAYYRQLSLNEK